MSAYCHMKTKKRLIAQEVEADLKDVIHRKFNDLLRIQCYIKNDEICDWNISYDEIHNFPVRLKTPEQLEFIHPDNTWAYWAQSVIEDELALKYEGNMLDEEYPHQILQPDPKNHSTFETYLETSIHHSSVWKKALIAIELGSLPEELKKL